MFVLTVRTLLVRLDFSQGKHIRYGVVTEVVTLRENARDVLLEGEYV